MPGRLTRECVDEVRQRARIDEVVGERVQLRPAGVGSLKGLCPFHDERTPSFHVRPQVGLWHCFGCGEGGDVISFLQKLDALGFTEAVEYLAGRFGIELRYEEGGGPRERTDVSQRQRLLEAHRIAAEFYLEQLSGAEAMIARTFLSQRGFDRAAASVFGVGYAPQGWENLAKVLRGKGFTERELLASGLVTQGNRGVYDRFRGRLMWPIRDLTGEVIGFGARRLHEDDQGPKYLNTPESPIYHKSQVLYGVDLAKREISKRRQVVIVEGYTDVMAMHLAGVPTAIATCGTAFGEDHIRVVRRLLGDSQDAASGVLLTGVQARGGEVIFTFDGDEAGQKAALRAFADDQRFYSQTFVAVAPAGLDPCELRQQRGDAALIDLVEGRQPLFRFAIRTALAGVDLSGPEGRVAGLRLAAPVVGQIRDTALRWEYARQLAGWLGMDEATVRRAVADAGRQAGRHSAGRTEGERSGGERAGGDQGAAGGAGSGATGLGSPGRDAASAGGRGGDPIARAEREALEAALQYPELVPLDFDDLSPDIFSVPAFRAVFDAIRAAGGVQSCEGSGWLESVREQASELVAGLVTELAVTPLPIAESRNAERGDPAQGYVRGVVERMVDVAFTREIGEAKAALQRLDAHPDSAEYQELFARLVSLETRRHVLRQDR